MLVPLQGASVRVACALERACWCCCRCRCLCQSDGGSGHGGAAAGCSCRVPLQGAAVRGVRFGAGMLVPLSKCMVCALWFRVPLQGAA